VGSEIVPSSRRDRSVVPDRSSRRVEVRSRRVRGVILSRGVKFTFISFSFSLTAASALDRDPSRVGEREHLGLRIDLGMIMR